MAKSQTPQDRGAQMLKEAGYGRKKGGGVKGAAAKPRMDRRARGGSITEDQPDDDQGNRNAMSKRADGGRVGKKGGQTIININAGGDDKGDDQRVQAAHQAGIQQGTQLGAQAAAAKLAGGAPGGPPPGAPMGGPPRPPMAGPPGPPPGAGPGGPMPPPPGAGGPPGMPPHPMMPPPGAGGPPPPGMMPRKRGGGV